MIWSRSCNSLQTTVSANYPVNVLRFGAIGSTRFDLLPEPLVDLALPQNQRALLSLADEAAARDAGEPATGYRNHERNLCIPYLHCGLGSSIEKYDKGPRRFFGVNHNIDLVTN
jgi:hypothetical protein